MRVGEKAAATGEFIIFTMSYHITLINSECVFDTIASVSRMGPLLHDCQVNCFGQRQ